MLIQGMLQQALTDLFSRNMLNHGALFFERLRRLKICPPEEIDDLEAHWLELVRTRQDESQGSSQALKEFSATLSELFERNVGTLSDSFGGSSPTPPTPTVDESS